MPVPPAKDGAVCGDDSKTDVDPADGNIKGITKKYRSAANLVNQDLAKKAEAPPPNPPVL